MNYDENSNFTHFKTQNSKLKNENCKQSMATETEHRALQQASRFNLQIFIDGINRQVFGSCQY